MKGLRSLAVVALAAYLAGRKRGQVDGETGTIRRLLDADLLQGGRR